MKHPNIKVNLIGADGNVFNVIGMVSKALKEGVSKEAAKEFSNECFGAGSYEEVLRICMEWVVVK